MNVRALLLATALALGGASLTSVADAKRRGVELEVAPSCERVDVAQLARLLDVEERRGPDSEVGQTKVQVSCEGQIATLSVERRQGGSLPRVRELAVSDVAGEVGARVLSLAAIELLNDSEQSAPPAAEPESKPEPEPPPLAAPVPTPLGPSVRLMAAGGLQSFALDSPLFGGGISVDFLRLTRLGLRLEVDVAVADHHYDFGSARVQLTSMSVQAGYLALHETWTARAFIGYRFGTARIAGEVPAGSPAREGTVAGACGGPLLSAGLGLRSGSWVAELAAEGGLVSFPLEGRIEGQAPIQLDGYWLGLSLNLGVLL